MNILAIESSCDETSAAVVEIRENKLTVLSNVTATSLSLHAATGGIIPENAARMQVKYIMPVIVEALIESENSAKSDNQKKSVDQNVRISEFSESLKDRFTEYSEFSEKARNILTDHIDAIAVTYGPGLIGSLLVGVETAKTLSYTFQIPLIPVNHLLAHIYANYINRKVDEIKFPFIGLIVSGGHTDLLLFKNHNDYEWLGGTRDDAAGEAFDKIGRLLNLSYPAGPEIEHRSKLITTSQIAFKSPLIQSDDLDFSFSGLKTEVMRFVKSNNHVDTNLKNQICFATQKAIIDVLVKKTLHAAQVHNAEMILVGGGVSANETFKDILSSKSEIPILFPEKKYSTDNAAMIGSYAVLNFMETPWQEVVANPELYFA